MVATSLLALQRLLPLCTETHKNRQQAYAASYPGKKSKTTPPTNLKLAPVAAVPHKSRNFRLILDLSFAVKAVGGAKYTPVNQAPDDPFVPSHRIQAAYK